VVDSMEVVDVDDAVDADDVTAVLDCWEAPPPSLTNKTDATPARATTTRTAAQAAVARAGLDLRAEYLAIIGTRLP
ncbi:MAG: hypothetical protein ACRD6W_08015, partial [Nitrososphaerales archaeon]